MSGGVGSWLVLVHWVNEGEEIGDIKTVKVDGDKIKPNTLYTLDSKGNIVEVPKPKEEKKPRKYMLKYNGVNEKYKGLQCYIEASSKEEVLKLVRRKFIGGEWIIQAVIDPDTKDIEYLSEDLKDNILMKLMVMCEKDLEMGIE